MGWEIPSFLQFFVYLRRSLLKVLLHQTKESAKKSFEILTSDAAICYLHPFMELPSSIGLAGKRVSGRNFFWLKLTNKWICDFFNGQKKPSCFHQETLNVFLQWRGKLLEDCIEITVESRGGAADYQPQLWSFKLFSATDYHNWMFWKRSQNSELTHPLKV